MKEIKYIIIELNTDISKFFNGDEIELAIRIKTYEDIKNINYQILKESINDAIEKSINNN